MEIERDLCVFMNVVLQVLKDIFMSSSVIEVVTEKWCGLWRIVENIPH